MTTHDDNSRSDNKNQSHDDHHHQHDHKCNNEHKCKNENGCNHDHSCQKQDHQHNHEEEHHHHHHEHGPHCNHDHDSPEKYQRYDYTNGQISQFKSQEIETLIQSVNNLLENEFYGKAVPILEIISTKLDNSKETSPSNSVNLFETKHHLAVSYGIIGEHDKSLPLWKEVLAGLEKSDDIHETLEAYYNAALSAEQAKKESEFLLYLNDGLKIAKSRDLQEWEATFEHELAVHYFDNEDFQTAENKLKKSIEIFSKIGDEESLISSYYYLAYISEKQNNIPKAKETYEKALLISKQENIRDFVEYERSLIEERLSIINNSQLHNKLLNF